MNRSAQIPVQPFFWGFIHGINDLFAGFLLAHLAVSAAPPDLLFWLSVYAVLGFGGQLPVGIWLDRSQRLSLASKLALGLLALAIAASLWQVETGIVLAGVASALVHVTGGAVCLQESSGKAGWLGIFTAPGVLGLAVGASLGEAGWGLPVGLLLLVLAGTVFLWKQPPLNYIVSSSVPKTLDSHDWVMLLLLMLMSFRSLVYDLINQLNNYPDYGLLYLGLSAFAGKLLGGWMADTLGWKPVVYGSLVAACLFLGVGPSHLYTLCAGIACLQSSVPLTLLMMARSLPGLPATASAFSLGVSVALAGLPLYLFPNKGALGQSLLQPTIGIPLVIAALVAWWVWFRMLQAQTKR